jgi:hypothetical protein
MENIEISIEKMSVITGISLTETFDELAAHYKGNHELLSHTFPLLALEEENKIHSKRYLGKDEGIYYYSNYPWQITQLV